MTTLRRFCFNDLLRMSSLHIDHLGETNSLAFFSSYLLTFPNSLVVAEAPGHQIMGFVIGKIDKIEIEKHCEIVTVTTAQEYKKPDLVKGLIYRLEEVSDKIEKANFMEVYIELSNKTARETYERLGYKFFEQVQAPVSGNKELIKMLKALPRFIALSEMVSNMHPKPLQVEYVYAEDDSSWPTDDGASLHSGDDEAGTSVSSNGTTNITSAGDLMNLDFPRGMPSNPRKSWGSWGFEDDEGDDLFVTNWEPEVEYVVSVSSDDEGENGLFLGAKTAMPSDNEGKSEFFQGSTMLPSASEETINMPYVGGLDDLNENEEEEKKNTKNQVKKKKNKKKKNRKKKKKPSEGGGGDAGISSIIPSEGGGGGDAGISSIIPSEGGGGGATAIISIPSEGGGGGGGGGVTAISSIPSEGGLAGGEVTYVPSYASAFIPCKGGFRVDENSMLHFFW